VDAVSAPGRDVPEWWGADDEAALRAEVAKLYELDRPIYTERRMHRMVYEPIVMPRRRRWGREIGAWLVIVAAFVAVILAVNWVAEGPPDDPGPIVTPTTYGPGPTGGAR